MNELYVCYDVNNGSIYKITPQIPEADENFINVDYQDVKTIITGEETITKYQVLFNPKKNKLDLFAKGRYEERDFIINELIYEIPEDLVSADITIIHDTSNLCWKILISAELEIYLSNIKASLVKNNIYFSVTEPSNPNVLIRLLKVNLDQLVKNHYFIIPFDNDWEKDLKKYSLFTNKRFDSYVLTRN